MSLEIAQDIETPCPKTGDPVSTAVLLADDTTFENPAQEVSFTLDNVSATPTMETMALTDVNGEVDVIAEAFEKRKQPLMELAYSEESYVRRLRMVYQLYMPAPYRVPSNSESNVVTAVASSTLPLSTSGFEELANKLPPGGPAVPDDLVARWRILWGNWMQLFEWHTGFYEKLRVLLEEDPDRIPKLFVDSRARLRSIYSKYCENQIKAAHIAEQHKEFFDEWRLHVGDKEDVVSLLMQPVQRIMRYQLPISEIVKWTERAKLPSVAMWQKALDIMKEIPKDTQLILEAARIDGFPGVITALGTLRIRGDLLVASLSRTEVVEALRFYAKILNVLPFNSAPRNASCFCPPTKLHLQSSSLPEDEAEVKLSSATSTTVFTTSVDGPVDNSSLMSTFAALSVPNASTIPPPSPSTPPPIQNQINRNSVEVGDTIPTQPPPPLLPGGQKFMVSRLFLFDRMLLVTEEVKAKRKGTIADAFAQSTYQFRAAVNVNKMKFEPHWYMCNFASELGAVPTVGAGLTDTSSLGTGSEQGALFDWPSVCAALEFAASDDLRFALWDQTPGRDVIYIIDPQTVAIRSAWMVHLRDIQRMQQQLLMALEDPTRFASGEKEWGFPPAVKTETPTHRSQMSRGQVPVTLQSSFSIPHTSQQTRKWPSFSMRRSGRLGSACSTVGSSASSHSHLGGGGGKSKPITPAGGGNSSMDDIGSGPMRSFSAERHRLVPSSPAPMHTVDLVAASNERASNLPKSSVVRSASSPHRKQSNVEDRCSTGFGGVDGVDWVESTHCDIHRNSGSFQKTKKAFTSLFGKHPKKGCGPVITLTPGGNCGGCECVPQHLSPSSTAHTASPTLPAPPCVDSLPPPHPTNVTSTLTNTSDSS